jgi:pimeloyl-ACP methyl ester carboxylesterase
LPIGGIHLYYEISGQGPPLLFIHGLGSSARDWELQVAPFSDQYQVVTFDVRGHGQSDKPPGPYSIPLFANDTAELIKALGIATAITRGGAPVHVVGISMGGMIAFQLAVSYPELIRSMVIVNSGPELILRTFGERLQALQRLLVVRLLGMRKMGEILSKRLFPKPEQVELRQMLVERWAENDVRAYSDAARGLLGWSVADHLSTIECPTLVIAAEYDYTPVARKEAYVARMPRAELVVIEDSRHATPVEHPERFNQVLASFLSNQA